MRMKHAININDLNTGHNVRFFFFFHIITQMKVPNTIKTAEKEPIFVAKVWKMFAPLIWIIKAVYFFVYGKVDAICGEYELAVR